MSVLCWAKWVYPSAQDCSGKLLRECNARNTVGHTQTTKTCARFELRTKIIYRYYIREEKKTE